MNFKIFGFVPRKNSKTEVALRCLDFSLFHLNVLALSRSVYIDKLNVPVVATDCLSGPREILDDGTLGTLVEVGDMEGLAKDMLQELRRTEKVNFDAKI